MKNFYIKQWFFLVIILLMVLPIIQMTHRILPDKVLAGVQVAESAPTISFNSLKSGEFQNKFNNWFNQNFGLREYFIKTYNQLLFSVFTQTTENSSILIGKDDQLYEKSYIYEYLNMIPPLEMSLLEEKVKDLKELQTILRGRGIPLIVVITPSKAAIYPEYIPTNMIKQRIQGNRNYDNLVSLLKQYNINYIDGHEITLKEKSESKYPLFPNGGTHWNYLGSFFTSSQLISKIEELKNKKLTNINITNINVDSSPQGTDKDLALLLNIWKPPIKYLSPHPIIGTKKDTENNYKPNLLIEGGSFTGMIIDQLHQNNVTSNIDLYFYYNKLLSFPEGKSGMDKGDLQTVDWENNVFNRDAIIIEMNEQNIPKVVDGFIQDAINMLKASDVNFTNINKDLVVETTIDNKKGYILKRGANANGVIYMNTDQLNLLPNVDYVLSYKAKGFGTLKSDLFPDNLPQFDNTNIGEEYKEYSFTFKSPSENMRQTNLRFFIDGLPGVTDKDTYLYDIKFYKKPKH